MKYINDDNFIVVQGWMRNALQLKGNKLLIYAVIYGFSQDGKSWFQGSLEYLGEWAGTSKETVCRLLKQMVSDGILEKKIVRRDGQDYPIYRATPIDKMSTPPLTKYQCPIDKKSIPIDKISMPPLTKYQYPIDKLSINNIANNINKNIDKNIDIYNEFQKYWNEHTAGAHVNKIKKLTDTRRKHLKSLINQYGEDDIYLVFDKVANSHFLSGKSGKWHATFDWVIKPANFIKVIEGNFDDRDSGTTDDSMISGLAAYMEG